MGLESQFLTKQEQRRRSGAAVLSFGVSVVLLVIKFWAYNITRSQAVFSDAVESIANVVTAALAGWVIWYSAKPKDEDHPYGHGKVEFFSAAFEGGLITFASIAIIAEAVKALWRDHSPQRLESGLVIVAAAGVINLALGFFLVHRGKKLASMALRASGKHVISDFWTSAMVVLGLLIVQFTGWSWIDSYLAIGVGLWLGYNGISLVRESFSALMDSEDPKILNALTTVFSECYVPGIIQIHNVRVIRSGWYHHIDAHVVMPEFWDVRRVHDIINQFEKSVIQRYEYGGEMNYHVDPCRKAYCRVCAVENCPIRVEQFQKAMPVDLAQIRSPDEPLEFRRRPKARE